MPEPIQQEAIKRALRTWCEGRNIRPAQFGRDMGYRSSTFGWALLRGAGVVTMDCLGRFLLAYGGQAADEVLALANTQTEEVK